MGFGSGAVPEEKSNRNPFVNMWLNPPDYESAREAFTMVGKLKAEIQLLEGDIKDTEREARKGSRKAEAIDAAKQLTAEERDRLNRLKADLHKWEWQVKWLDYHKEVARLVGFVTR